MATIEVKVPDIGDFKDVPVIELLVKPGDHVDKEDSLVTLESDKATMEVPSTHSGTLKELRVRVGDKVSQGTLIAILETEGAAAAAAPAAPPASALVPLAAAPQATPPRGPSADAIIPPDPKVPASTAPR